MSKHDVAVERKSQIVQATVECISKFGYNNFSMQDVARAAGVSKGIIHYYFLNKDELMLSVLQRVSSDIEQVLSDDLEALSDPKEKLRLFMNVCCKVVSDSREYYQVSMDFWTQINQKDGVKQIIAEHYRTFRKALTEIIKEGVEAGVFRDVDPVGYSTYLIASIDGVSLQWLFDEEAFDHGKQVEFMISEILESIALK